MFKETREKLMLLGVSGLILLGICSTIGGTYSVIKISTEMSRDFATTINENVKNFTSLDNMHPFNHCLIITTNDKARAQATLQQIDAVCSKLLNDKK